MDKHIQLDQFFTPIHKAKEYLNLLNKKYDLKSFDNVIEPSAGSGSFYNNMPKNRLGLDLDPKCDGVIKTDFFDYDLPKGKNIVIGNPPYGKRGSLAMKFINRCANNAEVIAFVLPRGFMRSALINGVDNRFHLVHQELIDTFNFPDGTERFVKSVFQIWEKKDKLREKIVEPTSHEDFEMIHRHVSWTSKQELEDIRKKYPIAIGQNTLRVVESKNITKGSNWFIKPKKVSIKKIKEIFKDAKFTTAYYTLGAPSLSKGDIINEYKKRKV